MIKITPNYTNTQTHFKAMPKPSLQLLSKYQANPEFMSEDTRMLASIDWAKIRKLNSNTCEQTTQKAHPDFYELEKQFSTPQASNYFRRGAIWGLWSETYKEVIDVFSKVFSPAQQAVKKMLIVGIGESQEPFSHLAAIKEIVKTRKLDDVVELHTIDLQAKPPKQVLCQNAFFDKSYEPPFAKTSFVIDAFPQHHGERRFRVNDEIFDFLSETYDNNSQAQWATRVQDGIKNYPEETFDVISANNTLGYIKDDAEFCETLENIQKSVKRDGYLITDDFDDEYLQQAGILDNFNDVNLGIWQKK